MPGGGRRARDAAVASALVLVALSGCGRDGQPFSGPSPTGAPIAASPSPSTATATPSPTLTPTPSASPSPTRVVTPAPPKATAAPRTTARPATVPVARQKGCETPPAASTGGAGRTVTTAAPLDILILGDSMQESSGSRTIGFLDTGNKVAGCVDIHYSTGLVRDDYFDWPAHVGTHMAQRDPEAVVFMVGGNDGQDMSVNGTRYAAGSAQWRDEYQRRAVRVMRTLSGGGRRSVYYLGMPPARSDRLSRIYTALNQALVGAAKQVPGVRYLDTWSLFSVNGAYCDSCPDESGTVRRMRGSDGIHLSIEGANYLSRVVGRLVDRDWHVR